MNAEKITQLFATEAHNPSFAAVRKVAKAGQQPIDFCVPVNRYFPPASLLAEIQESLPDIVKYYPDYAATHQQSASEVTGIPANNLVVANGSTELITLLCQSAPGPFACDVPTFGRWTDLPVQGELTTHFMKRHRKSRFELDVEQIVAHVRRHRIRTLVLCNPNNPTGAALEQRDIEEIVYKLADLDLLIIDESFIDFASIGSVSELATHTANLVVVKSIGKSLGWHGVRLGYAVAETAHAEQIRQRMPYWNINALAAFVLERLPNLRNEFEQSLLLVRADRKSFIQGLSTIPRLNVFPSQANFVFVELEKETDGRWLRDALLSEHRLMVRACGNKLGTSDRYLRLAVNHPAENDRLIEALRAMLDG